MGAGLLASSGRSSCLSDLEPPPGLTQGPLLCVRASFSQDGFYHQGVWEVDKNYRDLVPLPTLTPEEPFCTCVIQEVPWPQASEICGLFICYPSRTQLLRASSIIILQLSVHREQGTVAGPGTHLPPASVLSHVHVEQLRILSKWKDTVMPIPCQEVLLQ